MAKLFKSCKNGKLAGLPATGLDPAPVSGLERFPGVDVEAAGLAKRRLYELEPGEIGRDTYRRAKESMDAVNVAIVDLIRKSWGRT